MKLAFQIGAIPLDTGGCIRDCTDMTLVLAAFSDHGLREAVEWLEMGKCRDCKKALTALLGEGDPHDLSDEARAKRAKGQGSRVGDTDYG